MSRREGAARTRLQIALEAEGARLISELDDDVKQPRSARSSVGTVAGVVANQSCLGRRETDIEMWTVICVSQNVDESLVSCHTIGESKPDASAVNA
jgi:hypothetical protein